MLQKLTNFQGIQGPVVIIVMDGYGLEDAIRRGQIAARHACTLRGTSDGLINRQRLDALFAERRAGRA